MKIKKTKVNKLVQDKNKFILCDIVHFLAQNGIVDNSEIAEIGHALTNHDKLRGIKRSNTCFNNKLLKAKKAQQSDLINDFFSSDYMKLFTYKNFAK
jgi:hypothetical protein